MSIIGFINKDPITAIAIRKITDNEVSKKSLAFFELALSAMRDKDPDQRSLHTQESYQSSEGKKTESIHRTGDGHETGK